MYTCLFSLDMNKKHYYIDEPRSVSQNGSNTSTYFLTTSKNTIWLVAFELTQWVGLRRRYEVQHD